MARLVRVGMLGLDWWDIVEPQTADIAWHYGIYFSTVCVLVVTFGLVLMANERAEHQLARQIDARHG